MHLKDVDRGELIAFVGGIVLAISLFLAWFTLGNPNTTINTCRGPNSTCTGWASLSVFRYLLLAAAVAPAVLLWIIIRGHGLSWPRGELTAVVALVAFMEVLFRGVIDPPGQPHSEIGLTLGFFVALVGCLLMLAGSVYRSQEGAAPKKPPGVL